MRSILVGGLVGAALLSGCSASTETTTLLWYRAPCSGPFLHLCPFERTPDGQTHIVYDQVSDYQLTWGVEADVEYRIDRADPDVADAVDHWIVVNVVATRAVAVGETARWGLSARDDYFTAVGDHVEAFGTAVACEPAMCTQLTTVDPIANRSLTIEYTGDPAIPLRALAITAL